MSTLNPNLLASETTAILYDAVEIMQRKRKRNLFPEVALLALLRRPEHPPPACWPSFANNAARTSPAWKDRWNWPSTPAAIATATWNC
ncbi:MAG: hypothetical protein HC915_12955 [Anaerolineae bacterium]|nr:hypothetical protein [Anaerolineae bacterium]